MENFLVENPGLNFHLIEKFMKFNSKMKVIKGDYELPIEFEDSSLENLNNKEISESIYEGTSFHTANENYIIEQVGSETLYEVVENTKSEKIFKIMTNENSIVKFDSECK